LGVFSSLQSIVSRIVGAFLPTFILAVFAQHLLSRWLLLGFFVFFFGLGFLADFSSKVIQAQRLNSSGK
jgi:hypothetical protein